MCCVGVTKEQGFLPFYGLWQVFCGVDAFGQLVRYGCRGYLGEWCIDAGRDHYIVRTVMKTERSGLFTLERTYVPSFCRLDGLIPSSLQNKSI